MYIESKNGISFIYVNRISMRSKYIFAVNDCEHN